MGQTQESLIWARDYVRGLSGTGIQHYQNLMQIWILSRLIDLFDTQKETNKHLRQTQNNQKVK